jgi:hypothetical protein
MIALNRNWVALGTALGIALIVACSSDPGPECFAAVQCVAQCGGQVMKSGCGTKCDAPLFDQAECTCNGSATNGTACKHGGMMCNGPTSGCSTVVPKCVCTMGVFVCDQPPNCFPEAGPDTGPDAPADAPVDAPTKG